MGHCCSSGNEGVNSLDRELLASKKEDQATWKIVLTCLGEKGSGTTTILKQLNIIYGDGYSTKQRKAYKQRIHDQLLDDMFIAIDCVLSESMQLSPAAQNAALKLQCCTIIHEDTPDSLLIHGYIRQFEPIPREIHALCQSFYAHLGVTPPIAQLIETLWKEPAIRQIYARQNTSSSFLDCDHWDRYNFKPIAIDYNSAYFWNRIDEISRKEYIPTDADILRVYDKTVNKTLDIVRFKDESHKSQVMDFHMYNKCIGERKKYIHCFEHVTAMLFVASLTCYDDDVDEDCGYDAMVGQLELFEHYCDSIWLRDVRFIVFLNKTDLFEQKIQKVPITECSALNEFVGDTTDYNETTEFIKERFMDCDESMRHSIVCHMTTAIATDNIHRVFNDFIGVLS
eukprot:180733_1